MNSGARLNLRLIILAVVPITLLFAAVAIFFNKMVFSNLVLARGDVFLYFFPYWQAAADALRIGRIPLWNPNLFMGAPFVANSQSGFFYPLNWPLWLALTTPYAINGTILIHLLIAGSGTYLAGRRCLSLSRPGSMIVAFLFGFGGYYTAQVEHVNQFQGLAWFPWLFAVSGNGTGSKNNKINLALTTAALGLFLALQLLAGHTQSAFISVVGIIVWQAAKMISSKSVKTSDLVVRLLPLVIGGLIALLLAGIQILPAAELTQFSSRQGGLPANEALSFSLHPLIMSPALLPTIGHPQFSEYIAMLPLAGLMLALIGAWDWRSEKKVRATVILSLLGILLAFGIFNPIYQILVRMPVFNLFRVPARWLVLYVFGVSLLAGAGWDKLTSKRDQASVIRPLNVSVILLVSLMLWSIVSVQLTRFLPVGEEATVVYPNNSTWIMWLLELAISYILIFLGYRRRSKGPLYVLMGVGLFTLFLSSRSLPYNNLTTPEAYTDIRPPIGRLLAQDECNLSSNACTSPARRMLSLSDIFFDVGDQGELDSIYQTQLPERSRYDYTIAIKQKEIIAPNLPLAYGLASMDGFDGGILPLRNFTELMDLILPNGVKTMDGRLREHLPTVPEERWLDLFNVGNVITDKVGDTWRSDVFFDLRLETKLDAENPQVDIGYLPKYEATGLLIISDGMPGKVMVDTVLNQSWILTPTPLGDDLFKVTWPNAATADRITMAVCPESGSNECNNEWRILGITLVDERDETFQSLSPGQYRLIHSGDVKIYENMDTLPRAFLVYEWLHRPSVEASIQTMRRSDFDPANVAVIVGDGPERTIGQGSGTVAFSRYLPEQIEMIVDSDSAGLLVLTDSYYPGWEATIDGESTPILHADGLFRAVEVSEGRHKVEMSFKPNSFTAGWIASLTGIIILMSLMVFGFVRRMSQRRP
jgi:hypothetical protein